MYGSTRVGGVVTTSGGGLAVTGFPIVGLALLALGLLVVGLGFARAAAVRRSSSI